MHRYIGEMVSYDLFNTIAIVIAAISGFFYFKSKRNAISLYSKYAIGFALSKNYYFGKIVEAILVLLEITIMTAIALKATEFNRPLGDILNTSANYFGTLFGAFPLWLTVTLILMTNPLKSIDVATMVLPICLFFVKIACFLNGCCWGIPWEHGLYNYHYDHPGYQVPVQAIEAFWALAIFVFLSIYRKKAKPGTLFPMYMILYSATRFCSEFLRADSEPVIGIFYTYHILCVSGVVVGLVLLLIVRKFGDKINAFFDNKHAKADAKIAKYMSIPKEELKRQAQEKSEKRKKEREKAKLEKKRYAQSRKL